MKIDFDYLEEGLDSMIYGFGLIVVIIVVMITMPIWIIPYGIYKLIKRSTQ